MTRAFRPVSAKWLDKNENIDLEYFDKIASIFTDIPLECYSCYPDCAVLYEKLAVHLGVSGHQLFLAAGSDGVIRAAYETFVSPGDAVVFTQPTFAMYSVYNQIFGAKACPIVYRASEQGPILDIDFLIKSITSNKPKLVCLPNADSPTGTIVEEVDLRQIIATAAEVGAVILIDEAYYPFYNQTVISWVNEYPNLVVTRTFSKAWGLAGVRVGYGVGQHELIKLIHKVRPMYELGALSVVIVTRVLDYYQAMLASVIRLNTGKAYFQKAMQDLGFRTYPSYGNFLHIAFADKAEVVHNSLKDSVLYRHDFPNTALSGYSRFSATTQENFKPIIDIIASIA